MLLDPISTEVQDLQIYYSYRKHRVHLDWEVVAFMLQTHYATELQHLYFLDAHDALLH